MTPNDLIALALKKSGPGAEGQTPSAENVNDALLLLNAMMGQWAQRRWLVYHLTDVSKVANGSTFYTIGAGGDFNTPRPDRIERAYARQLTQGVPNQVDYPLTVIQSYEDWAAITLKQQPGFPQAVFLDSDYPLGKLYVWPVPSSAYEIHVVVKAALASFASLVDAIVLPDEYTEALLYNLIVRLRAFYGLPADPVVVGLAKAALNTVRNSNTQIPLLRYPAEITGGGNYNVYSDGYR